MNFIVYYTNEEYGPQLRSGWRATVQELNEFKATIPSEQWLYYNGNSYLENSPPEFLEMSGNKTILQVYIEAMIQQYMI